MGCGFGQVNMDTKLRYPEIIDSLLDMVQNSVMHTDSGTAIYKRDNIAYTQADESSVSWKTFFYSFLDPPIIQPNQPLPVLSAFWTAFSAVLSSGPPTNAGDVDVAVIAGVLFARASCTAAATPKPCPPCCSCFLTSSTANRLCS